MGSNHSTSTRVTQKNWVGVFNNNPYATDYIVTTPQTVGGDAIITTVTIGGAIEKYIF